LVGGRYIGGMVRRLLIGPVLILMLLAVMWADEALTAVVLPSWLRWLALADGRAAPGLVLMVAGVLICARAGIELARIYHAAGLMASKRVVVFAAVTGVVAGGLSVGAPARSAGGGMQWGSGGGAALATGAVLVMVVALLIHTRYKTIKGAAGAVGAALMAFAYTGITLGFIMAMRTEFSAWVVLGVLMTAKSCDIGAYFTGRAIGRHKLIPWVSPGKTWEGLAGGMVTAGLVGMGLTMLGRSWGGLESVPNMTPLGGAMGGALLGLAAQLGDLSASVLKRDAGMKDSGRLIPGMGGIIDVIDSLVLAGPVAYWTLVWFRW